jgi:hypothetical protein
MLEFHKSRDGTKSMFPPRSGNALEKLVVEGLIRYISGNGYGDFYIMTQRGRDYALHCRGASHGKKAS